MTFGVANICLDNGGKPFTVPGISPPAGCDGSLGRNRFTSPNFFQWDMRLSKRIPLGERFNLDLIADSFNLFNRDNQRVAITANGLTVNATNFVQSSSTAGLAPYPGYYQLPKNFLKPNAAYPPRQIQLGMKLVF